MKKTKKIAVQKTTQIDIDGVLTDVTVISINGNINGIFLPGQVQDYDEHVQTLKEFGYELKVEEEE